MELWPISTVVVVAAQNNDCCCLMALALQAELDLDWPEWLDWIVVVVVVDNLLIFVEVDGGLTFV